MRLIAALSVLLAASVAAADPTVVKLATVAPDGTPWAVGLNDFKKQVEQLSGGSLKVKVFLGGALGDENDTVLACKRGQIQAVGASTGALASQVPELSVLEMPYLFRTPQEADHVLQKALAGRWEKLFETRGLVLGFWSENGYRSFGTRAAPVRTPDDLKGKKMRSQEQPVHVEMYRALGASPVPIPITETLTALQTGVVDGYDNTLLFAQAASLTSATKYFTMSEHIYQPAAIVFNGEFFAKLTPEQQKALLSARNDLGPRILAQVRALAPALEANLVQFGIEVIRPDAAARAKFEAAGAAARQAYLKQASAGEKALAVEIDKALAALRGGK
jgi:TRAP-type transport system periplasmic protein